jgi:hypothetical protein
MFNVYKNQQSWQTGSRNLYPRQRGYSVLPLRPSVHPKIFFIAFFSATIDGRNLIFGHKLHIGMPYCGKRFWKNEHICSMCIKINKVGKQEVGI